MKKIIVLILSVIFFLTSGLALADNKRRLYREKNSRQERVYKKNHNHPYHQPRGHAYGHYRKHHQDRYKGYKYRGHYRWHEWRHERNRDRYRHGRYHHDDNGYMMFSYCNKNGDEKICFSISID